MGGEGPRRQKWRGGFRTRKEAEVELRRALTSIDKGGDPFPAQISLADYLARWLDYQALRVRPNTHKREADLLRLHVVPVIGHLRLDRIRPGHVQLVIDSMLERGLAPGTTVRARSVLGRATPGDRFRRPRPRQPGVHDVRVPACRRWPERPCGSRPRSRVRIRAIAWML